MLPLSSLRLLSRINLDPNTGATQAPGTQAAFAQAALATGNPASVHQAGQQARRLMEASARAVGQWVGLGAGGTVLWPGSTFEGLVLLMAGLGCATRAAAAPAGSAPQVLWLALEGVAPEPIGAAAGALGIALTVQPLGRVLCEGPGDAALATPWSRIVVDGAGPGAVEALALQARDGRGLWPLLQRTPWALDLGAAAALWPSVRQLWPVSPDAVLLSGAALGAPLGATALHLGPGSTVAPLWQGGGQQMGLRPGTEAKEVATAMAAALMALPPAAAYEAQQRQCLALEALWAQCAAAQPCGAQDGARWLPHVACLHGTPDTLEHVANLLWQARLAVGRGPCLCGAATLRVALHPGRPEDAVRLTQALEGLCKHAFSCASSLP